MDQNQINIGKIFSAAGKAFGQLADLTTQVLYADALAEGILTESHQELLMRAIQNFAEDLDVLSSQLKIRLESRGAAERFTEDLSRYARETEEMKEKKEEEMKEKKEEDMKKKIEEEMKEKKEEEMKEAPAKEEIEEAGAIAEEEVKVDEESKKIEEEDNVDSETPIPE